MCVGNIHEPQTGFDVTTLRFRYVDDNGRDEEETPDTNG